VEDSSSEVAGPDTLGAAGVRRIATRRRLLLRAAGLLALLAPARRSLAQAKGKPKPAAVKDVPWDARWELLVQLEIAEQPSSARYHRPYVAVWIEDLDGVPVRTLSLWVQNSGRGPRWIPDLRRWYKGERVRQLADSGDLVATVSSATRMPGAYKLVWNGRDDQNKPVRQGTYTLCIEAAREHGTYQILRKDITPGAKPFRADLGSNVEIKSASVDYHLRK
jgi:hypothetical protein